MWKEKYDWAALLNIPGNALIVISLLSSYMDKYLAQLMTILGGGIYCKSTIKLPRAYLFLQS